MSLGGLPSWQTRTILCSRSSVLLSGRHWCSGGLSAKPAKSKDLKELSDIGASIFEGTFLGVALKGNHRKSYRESTHSGVP